MFILEGFGGALGIILVIGFIISSLVSSANKKRQEAANRQRPANSGGYSSQHQPARNRSSVIQGGVEYDSDLLPTSEPLMKSPPPLAASAVPTAIDAKPKRRGSAAAAKARTAHERHAEGHNLQECAQVEESQTLKRIRELIANQPRSAIVVAEIFGPPRCRRPYVRR